MTTDRLKALAAATEESVWLRRVANNRTLLVNITKGMPASAPIAYWDSNATITINADRVTEMGVNIERIDAAKFRHIVEGANLETAVLRGLLCHEAGHVAISTDLRMAHPDVAGTLTILEELRVENYALNRAPYALTWLRASSALLMKQLAKMDISTRGDMLTLWALTRGRTYTGIVDPTETNEMDLAVRSVVGDETVDALSDIISEIVTLNVLAPEDADRMVELAREWNEIVGEDASPDDGGVEGGRGMPEEKPQEGIPGNSKPQPATKNDDDAEGDDDDAEGQPGDDGQGDAPEEEQRDDESAGGKSASGDDGEADGEASDADADADADADDAGGDEGDGGTPAPATADGGKPGDDSDDGEVERRGTGFTEPTDAEKRMVKQFAERVAADLSRTWGSPVIELAPAAATAARVFGAKRTEVVDTEVTADARRDVATVANVLGDLSLPNVSKTERQVALPPGRLNRREALRGDAERARGAMVSARPWKGAVRRHTASRPVVIGIATDTSGSMRWAEKAVSRFAYVYANAGHRIGARVAGVTFGDDVHATARPGALPTAIPYKYADGGSEAFDEGLAALDGVLHLTSPNSAARLLLVVSDGYLVRPGETDRANLWMERVMRAGTHVLWMTNNDAPPFLARLNRREPKFTLITVETGRQINTDEVWRKLNDATLKAISNLVVT